MEICKMDRRSSGWSPRAGFCEYNGKTLNCGEAYNLLTRCLCSEGFRCLAYIELSILFVIILYKTFMI